MQAMGQTTDWGSVGRRRVEAVVHTLAATGCRGESLAEVAHDARNMVTALGLYCDLLEEPGVLAVPFAHYGNELRLVAAASRRLVEKLVALDAQREREASRRGFNSALHRDANPGSEANFGEANFGPDGSGSNRPGAGRPGPNDPGLNGTGLNGTGLNGPGLNRPGLTPPGPNGLAADSPEARPELAPGAPSAPAGDSAAGGSPRQGPSPLPEGCQPQGGEISETERSLRWAHDRRRRWDTLFSEPVDNLAAELLANRNLLSALAGPGIAVTVDAEGGARPVRLTAEDLTRLLVNLVKNAAEAMPAAAGGRIQVSLREGLEDKEAGRRLTLAIEDNGLGIAPADLDRIFESGFTTRAENPPASGGWPVAHRGLGLAITRSIVEASGGRISVSNRPGSNRGSGARFEIELPVRAL